MIVEVKEDFDGRDGSDTLSGNRGTREVTRKFKVKTDDPYDDAAVVLGYGSFYGLPPFGSLHPRDAGMRCVNRRAVCSSDSQKHWTVDCSYTSALENEDGGHDENPDRPDPLQEPPSIDWDVEFYQRPATVDIDGKPVANSAGEPYADPAPEVDDVRITLTYSRNERTYSTQRADKFSNATNSAPFLGFLKRQAKCQGIKGSYVHNDGDSYYKVTYIFQFRRDGFLLHLLDAGYREKIDGNYETILGADDLPLSQPHPLDGAGRKLAQGADEKYLDHKVYAERDLNELNITLR